MTDKTIHVAIGVILHGGRCLITRRPEGGHLGGFWEFPGGKFLPDESAEDCLHREVFEEVGLKIEIDKPFPVINYSYPDRAVRLHFFLCRPAGKIPNLETASGVKWVLLRDLDQYKFPEANQSIFKLLKGL